MRRVEAEGDAALGDVDAESGVLELLVLKDRFGRILHLDHVILGDCGEADQRLSSSDSNAGDSIRNPGRRPSTNEII
jgi:hypothetical protein